MSPFSSTTNWRRNAGSSEFYRSSPKFTQPSASPDVIRSRSKFFDVNETLLDLTALDGHFERVFRTAGVREEWFKQVG